MKEKKQNQTGRPAWSYIISGGGEKKDRYLHNHRG
jgi:hypothetical protein